FSNLLRLRHHSGKMVDAADGVGAHCATRDTAKVLQHVRRTVVPERTHLRLVECGVRTASLAEYVDACLAFFGQGQADASIGGQCLLKVLLQGSRETRVDFVCLDE